MFKVIRELRSWSGEKKYAALLIASALVNLYYFHPRFPEFDQIDWMIGLPLFTLFGANLALLSALFLELVLEIAQSK